MPFVNLFIVVLSDYTRVRSILGVLETDFKRVSPGEECHRRQSCCKSS